MFHEEQTYDFTIFYRSAMFLGYNHSYDATWGSNCGLENREVMNKRIGDLAKNLNKSKAMENRSGASDVGNSYIIGELY